MARAGPVSSGGGGLGPARSRLQETAGGASVSTAGVACSLPASEAVTAVTSYPPTTHYFWTPRHQRPVVRCRPAAGTNLALTMLPKAMAYAVVAGVPPVYGLYASCAAPALALAFGSNRLLFTGPVGVMSAPGAMGLMFSAALPPLKPAIVCTSCAA
jgi:Sulfate permease family